MNITNFFRCLIITFTLITVFIVPNCQKSPVESPDNTLYTFDLQQLATGNLDFTNLSAKNPWGQTALLFRPDSAHNTLILATAADSLPWSSAKYLVADLYHANQHSNTFYFHFYGEDLNKPRIYGKMGVLPELKTRLVFPLQYLDGQTFFMERQERRLKGVVPGSRLPINKITKVTLGLDPVTLGFAAEMWITNLRLTKDKPAPLSPEKPIVDEFGQWIIRDWPGKIQNQEQLAGQLNEFYSRVKTAVFPEEWSQYGGWKAKKFKATGFFRKEHDGNRWWLVDPEGYGFFSLGVDVIRPDAFGPVTGMEDLHKWLPEKESEFTPARNSRGNYETVSFLTANLIRVFGENWQTKWQQLTKGFLIQTGFNTIGNWSDMEFIKSARMPYVLPLSGFPTTEVKLYRDFPDVFSDEFKQASKKYAQQMENLKDDPYLVGYFLRNEPLWAFGDNIIASEMLATDINSFTRKALVDWLGKSYTNNIKKLNKTWNTQFDSFQILETSPLFDAASFSKQAESDLRQFSGIMVDEYIKQPSLAVKRIDPGHMNLGIRYAGISSDLCYRGGEYFDVFSINSYTDQPDAKTINEIVKQSGKPVMIGEFHHGAIDMGLPSTGIRGVASQKDRGIAYRYYIEQGAVLPGLVGMHFFQLNDQPVLGRYDGENYNIGLVNICNLPYAELVKAVTTTNTRIYDVAAGKQKPFGQKAKLIPAIYF